MSPRRSQPTSRAGRASFDRWSSVRTWILDRDPCAYLAGRTNCRIAGKRKRTGGKERMNLALVSSASPRSISSGTFETGTAMSWRSARPSRAIASVGFSRHRIDDDRFSTASSPRHVTLNMSWSTRSIGAPRYTGIALAPDQFSEYEAYNFPGWDGYDAEPITRETVQAARSFKRLLPRDAIEPDIAPGCDGTIGFEWRFGSAARRRWIMVDVGPGDLITARQVDETGRIERMQPTHVETGARVLIDQLFS
jgi:hypothetical protein